MAVVIGCVCVHFIYFCIVQVNVGSISLVHCTAFYLKWKLVIQLHNKCVEILLQTLRIPNCDRQPALQLY